MEKVKNLEKTPDEIIIEERIKSGEEIEITEAVKILSMIRDNISFEEISNKTGKSISKIQEIQSIFNA